MNYVANINNKEISIVNFKSIPVVTTEMLANFYGTDANNIRKNFSNNKSRFVEGKHFFKIVGQELKDFVSSLKILKHDVCVNHIYAQISTKTRVLTLWTERGAARHAKMLDTDHAWDVFEKLESCYFHRQEILTKTHKSERAALNNAVNMLVAKAKNLNFSEAYKMIHNRFNINSIEEIPCDAIPIAVEYVHHLIALFGNSDKKQKFDTKYVNALARHTLWLNHWWDEFGDAIRKLSPTMGHAIHDHFKFAAGDARHILGRDVYLPIFELAQSHDWHKDGMDYQTLKDVANSLNFV